MLKTIAIVFGILIFLAGVLGFFPQFTPDGMLLGIFHVNTLHNIIHIATGIVAFLCGMCCSNSARWFFKIFGIVYTLVALLGFYYGDVPILGLIANNFADTILHLIIGVGSLILGFCCCCSTCVVDKDKKDV